ncbi:MAG: cbb3-type cytochrome c oxidase subunit I [Bacteroidetes bacterium]|nr:cbb3-type cytochrome c oxidase subunit I [Bacteroidota bacterium]
MNEYPIYYKRFLQFALGLLAIALVLGLLSAAAFSYPETFNKFLPFYQLRPFHTSAALFWIITASAGCILFYKNDVFTGIYVGNTSEKLFIMLWIGSILTIFCCYAFKKFGGREYWEFPPVLSIALLASWLVFMYSYFASWRISKNKKPLYVWMWSTGIFFFLITFVEQNLWLIPWFRSSFLKEITIQWKANGSMVGAWNQMIYGTALFLMVKISGDGTIAENKKAFFFYFLGLTNLMFNWGHHIYNVPNGSWIRNTAYAISMTELLIFINIIAGFKRKLDEQKRLKHIIPYRFLVAAEYWAFANLLLALLMSVPVVNRYTHGTHITVAHAMISTIGINTMILLGSIGYIINIDTKNQKIKNFINKAYWHAQVSLAAFGSSLVIAGIIKAYRTVAIENITFQEVMQPVVVMIKIFLLTGIWLAISLISIVVCYFRLLNNKRTIKIWKEVNTVMLVEEYDF